jgi:serine/threonine protein kinase/tetratricopeptide (TPR) repeat protein
MNSNSAQLFGLLAHCCGFISKEELVKAMNRWAEDKQQSLETVLTEQKAISTSQMLLLKQVEQEILQQHGQSVDESLSKLLSLGTLRKELEVLSNLQIDATLEHISPVADAEVASKTTRRSEASRYRAIRFHAKGGLGEVFVAKDEELNREVALKEIQQRFADRDESRERFKREAEITGKLEHPGIVPVYGLGQYSNGRPYYAMRFIRGVSLREAIDAFHSTYKESFLDGPAGLELRKLLRHFVDVCNAIEYAHSRGVIHRDLKPENIILGKYGETLVVDWGLAKAQGVDSSTATVDSAPDSVDTNSATPTIAGSAIGTPAYMSPEQAAGVINELGPATDIYALGATLFHLLVGQLPIAGNAPMEIIEKAKRGEIRRPRELRPNVPLPLEAVILKAIATSRDDRYPSSSELAHDVERWLADEPVSVYAEPILAQIRRWVRRHPATVSTVSATTLLFLVGAMFVAYLQNSYSRVLEIKNSELVIARNKAEAAEKSAVTEKELAETNLRYAMKGNDILGSVFANLDPQQNYADVGEFSGILKENLAVAVRELEGSAIGSPLVVADMQTTLGQSLFGLGEADQAVEILQKALATRIEKLGANHPKVLNSQNDLAVCYRSAGMLDQAIPIFEQTLKQLKESLGPGHTDTLSCMANLASSYEYAGDFDQAVSLYSETLALMKTHLGPDNLDTLKSMNNLASGYQSAGNLDLAIPLYEETVKLTESKLGKEHTETLTTRNNLATAYEAAGRIDEALKIHEATFKLRTTKLGVDHPDTLTSMNNLAGALDSIGKKDQALSMYEEVLRLTKVSQGDDHPDTLRAMNNLAATYNSMGTPERAIPIFEETVRLRVAKLGPDHPSTLGSKSNLAACYHKVGNVELAIPLFEETVKLMKNKLGPSDAKKLVTMNNLAKAYVTAKQGDKAVAIWNETIDLYRQQLGADSTEFAMKVNAISRNLLTAGEPAAAEEHLRSSLGTQEKSASDGWVTSETRYLLGVALMNQMKYQDSEPLLLAGLQGLEQHADAVPLDRRQYLLEAAQKLVEFYGLVDKPDEASKWKAKAAAVENELDSASDATTK